jgi:molybdate transport system ATP-binding protein
MTRLSIDATTTTGQFQVRAAFDAEPGITALFGPSGAGKSVTLMTIAGLLRPSSGTVAISGRTVDDPASGLHVPPQDRRIGMVFQSPSLLPHRSPLDNVAIGVRLPGGRSSRRLLARGWLERVLAGHLAAAPTTTLSGGEQQRVALARALAGQPHLLLLDEPFSALDLGTRRALRSLIRRLVDDEKVAALIVTHDLDDIVAIADQVVVYEPGETVGIHPLQPGAPDRVTKALGLTL